MRHSYVNWKHFDIQVIPSLVDTPCRPQLQKSFPPLQQLNDFFGEKVPKKSSITSCNIWTSDHR